MAISSAGLVRWRSWRTPTGQERVGQDAHQARVVPGRPAGDLAGVEVRQALGSLEVLLNAPPAADRADQHRYRLGCRVPGAVEGESAGAPVASDQNVAVRPWAWPGGVSSALTSMTAQS